MAHDCKRMWTRAGSAEEDNDNAVYFLFLVLVSLGMLFALLGRSSDCSAMGSWLIGFK